LNSFINPVSLMPSLLDNPCISCTSPTCLLIGHLSVLPINMSGPQLRTYDISTSFGPSALRGVCRHVRREISRCTVLSIARIISRDLCPVFTTSLSVVTVCSHRHYETQCRPTMQRCRRSVVIFGILPSLTFDVPLS